jgi:D-tyrosyl-tRNA(Tyr) deacylase
MFEDERHLIHTSVQEEGGEILANSQFTLYGDCRKGRRPSFTRAETPERAFSLYRHFIRALVQTGVPVQEGIFQAMMKVSLVNDGPFTLILESPAL